MGKVFYSYNAALDYAQGIGIDTHYFEWENRHLGGELTNLGQSVGFDIDGFSEVLPLIYVDEYDSTDRLGHTEHYKEIRHRGNVLHLLEQDRYYYISNVDKGKYGLSSLELLNVSYNTFQYFVTDLVAPQNIGKATKTKILNWAEYSDSLEREKISYWQVRKDRRDRVKAKILSSCPDAKLRITGEANGKYEFSGFSLQHISADGLKITWEFDGCGSIGRSYGYDYTKADRLANLLDGQGEA